jgi:membrane protein DedA with SNARE-associated domain
MLIIVILLIPYSILAVGTGYSLSFAYKNYAVVLSVGTACVFFGCWIGALISFLLGRYILRK